MHHAIIVAGLVASYDVLQDDSRIEVILSRGTLNSQITNYHSMVFILHISIIRPRCVNAPLMFSIMKRLDLDFYMFVTCILVYVSTLGSGQH